MVQIDTIKMDSMGQIIIPTDIRKDISEGEELIVLRRGEETIIRKTIPELALWSEDSLAEVWLNEEEDEAWKDL